MPAAYLKEKVACLQSRQADLDTAKAELKRRRAEMERQQAAPCDDDNRKRAPSVSRFPRAAYNMVAVACHLRDISNMADPNTNKKLQEAR